MNKTAKAKIPAKITPRPPLMSSFTFRLSLDEQELLKNLGGGAWIRECLKVAKRSA